MFVGAFCLCIYCWSQQLVSFCSFAAVLFATRNLNSLSCEAVTLWVVKLSAKDCWFVVTHQLTTLVVFLLYFVVSSVKFAAKLSCFAGYTLHVNENLVIVVGKIKRAACNKPPRNIFKVTHFLFTLLYGLLQVHRNEHSVPGKCLQI